MADRGWSDRAFFTMVRYWPSPAGQCQLWDESALGSDSSGFVPRRSTTGIPMGRGQLGERKALDFPLWGKSKGPGNSAWGREDLEVSQIALFTCEGLQRERKQMGSVCSRGERTRACDWLATSANLAVCLAH